VIHMRALIAKRENRLGRSWCGYPGSGSFQGISLTVAGNVVCTIVDIKLWVAQRTCFCQRSTRPHAFWKLFEYSHSFQVNSTICIWKILMW
jgi:hypothetical protein